MCTWKQNKEKLTTTSKQQKPSTESDCVVQVEFFSTPSHVSETLGWPHNTFVWCLWQRDVFIHRNRRKKAHNNSTTNINTLKYIRVQCDYSSWHAVRSLGVKPSLLPLSRGRRGKPLPPGRKWSALTGLTPSRSALIKGPHRCSNLLTWVWACVL